LWLRLLVAVLNFRHVNILRRFPKRCATLGSAIPVQRNMPLCRWIIILSPLMTMTNLRRRCAKGKGAGGKGCRHWQPCPVHPTSNWANNTSPPLPNNWKSLKRACFRASEKKYGIPRCEWCKTVVDLDVDHVIPRSAGGKDTLDNLQLLCGTLANNCHGKKTSLDKKKYR